MRWPKKLIVIRNIYGYEADIPSRMDVDTEFPHDGPRVYQLVPVKRKKKARVKR